MGLLSPWFLAGMAAVALPVWLHLLRQYKRTPQPFSSLMFFEKRVQSSVRHRRLRYLALLALRLLLLMLLALTFANPFIRRTAAVASRKKLEIVAIDRSFSMRSGGRMEEAKAVAHQVLSNGTNGGLVQVIALDSGVENLTQPETDRNLLNTAINSVGATDAASSYGELARALRIMEQTSGMDLNVDFISDMQQTSMPAFRDLQLGPHTTLRLHKVGVSNSPNWAVETVTTSPHVYEAKHTRLTTIIAGWNTQAAERTVSLVMDGRVVATKEVQAPAKGQAEVEFLGFNVPYGAHRGAVRIEPHDALPEDDSFAFSVERSDPRRVLFLYAGGRAKQGFYYKAAMESASDTGLTVELKPTEQAATLDLSKYAYVVLNDPGDLEEAAAQALCSYISRGGAAVTVVGPNTAREGRVPLSSDRASEARETQGAGYVETQHAALRGAGRFENVEFSESARITPKATARVLAKLADGSPLLMEETMGEGRMLIFASTLDNSTNDFPLHSSFVPFVVQTGHYLAGTEDAPSSVTAGTPVVLRRSRKQGTAADVIGPDGKHELPLNEATQALSFDLRREGFYEVQRADGRRMLEAVHADRRESNLTTVPEESLALWRNTGDTTAAAASGPTELQIRPLSLWRYAMALALLAALVESVFASRYLKEERQTA